MSEARNQIGVLIGNCAKAENELKDYLNSVFPRDSILRVRVDVGKYRTAEVLRFDIHQNIVRLFCVIQGQVEIIDLSEIDFD